MNLSTCKYDFASDNINIFVMVYDQSGSMDADVGAMLKANRAFYQDFSKFEEKGSIAIAKATFTRYFAMSDFDSVDKFDIGYQADGGTALYVAIQKAVANTLSYYNELIKRTNTRPRITFLVFTDGIDTDDFRSEFMKAKSAITELNSLDATTVFVAFREAIQNETGIKLGFSCTRNINTVQELISCLGSELSQSCKEQSKSAYSLKSNFFSKATTETENDAIGEIVFDDDDFFN